MLKSGRGTQLKQMLSVLLTTTALTLTSWSAHASSVAVDIRDLAKHAHDPMAQILVDTMVSNPSQFFPQGVRYSSDGPGKSRDWSNLERSVKKTRVNTVYGVELTAEPHSDRRRGSTQFELVAMIHSNANDFFFRKMRVTLGGAPLSVQSVQVLQDIPLSQTQFSVQVGLIQRKAILTDAQHGITKVYPLGVGSFDMGVREQTRGRVELLTPTFTNATLRRVSRKGTYESAARPSYFRSMPFMALHRDSQSNRHSGVAFHILQHPHSNPDRPLINPRYRSHQADYNYMIRGFDSHGCMRLREKDLYELFSILKGQREDRLRADVSLSLADTATHAYPEHPYPLDNTRYKRVKNYGTEADPRPGLDRHGLVETEAVEGAPPIDQLTPIDSQRAALEELENYNGGETGDEYPEYFEDELSAEEAMG